MEANILLHHTMHGSQHPYPALVIILQDNGHIRKIVKEFGYSLDHNNELGLVLPRIILENPGSEFLNTQVGNTRHTKETILSQSRCLAH